MKRLCHLLKVHFYINLIENHGFPVLFSLPKSKVFYTYWLPLLTAEVIVGFIHFSRTVCDLQNKLFLFMYFCFWLMLNRWSKNVEMMFLTWLCLMSQLHWKMLLWQISVIENLPNPLCQNKSHTKRYKHTLACWNWSKDAWEPIPSLCDCQPNEVWVLIIIIHPSLACSLSNRHNTWLWQRPPWTRSQQ